MSFFHNLNKKLDSIAARPESAQLNERDMGKHNNATTGFKAVAGAQFQKMKKAGQLEEEGMSRAAKGWKKYGDGMTELSRLGREGASEKKMDAARKKYDKYDNTEVDEGLGDMARAAGGAIVDRLTGKPTKAQYAARAARQADNVHGAEGKARRTDYLDQMDSRDKALGYDESVGEAKASKYGIEMHDLIKNASTQELQKMASDIAGGPSGGYGRYKGEYQDLVQAQRELLGPEGVANQRMQGVNSRLDQKLASIGAKNKQQASTDATTSQTMSRAKQGLSGMYEEGAAPMTPKQRSFAKLAPPDNKITFADKIAGAKKEVDEMLGDVAAEAMRSALGGGRKVMADEGNDFTKTRLDAIRAGKPTFKVGGKTYRVSGDTSDERAMDEASQDNAFTAHKRPRIEQPAKGSVEHGHKHDIKHDTTDPKYSGRIVTRRVDPAGISVGADDGQSSSDEPRGRGRPKGPAKAPERVTGGATRHKGGRKMTKEGVAKQSFVILDTSLMDQISMMDGTEVEPDNGVVFSNNPNVTAKLTAFAKANPQRLKISSYMTGDNTSARPSNDQWSMDPTELKEVDIADQGEYDQEGDMAKDSIKTVVRHAQALEKILGDNDNLPEWVQSKLAKIESMMTAVDDYMQNQETDQDDEKMQEASFPVPPGYPAFKKKKPAPSVPPTKDNKDDKHDEKKDKVKEDEPKKSKSKFKFGGSVYENLDAQLETLINESMNISVNMATSDDGQGDHTITVTASGEDAMTLAQLLKSAGLSQSSHAGCSTCGQSSCGCEQVDENAPDYPTSTEYTSTKQNMDPVSNDLNSDKSTGQTTIPVLASQLRRQVSMEESVKIERNLFDLYKNFAK